MTNLTSNENNYLYIDLHAFFKPRLSKYEGLRHLDKNFLIKEQDIGTSHDQNWPGESFIKNFLFTYRTQIQDRQRWLKTPL